VDGIGGRGTNTIEVGSELSANSGTSEVSFHHAELALSTAFPFVKLNLLALYCLKFVLVCLIPVDISDNARVLEIYDGIVNEKSRGGGRVKNVEVIIFDPRTVKVGSGMLHSWAYAGCIFHFHLLTKPFPSRDQPPIHLDHMTNHLTTHMTCHMPLISPAPKSPAHHLILLHLTSHDPIPTPDSSLFAYLSLASGFSAHLLYFLYTSHFHDSY